MTANVTFVVGGKGGTGATSLCVDLARSLVRQGQRVALVDADFSARRSVAVLLDGVRSLDAARTGPNVACAHVAGMTIVELTPTIDGAFTIGSECVASLAALVAGHDQVVVDAPQPYAAALRPLIEAARHVLLTVEPTILGLAGARTVQLELAKFGIPATHLHPVVVMRDSRAAVSRREIEHVLRGSIAREIPPLADRRYARALAALTELVTSEAPPIVGVGPSTTVPLGDRRLGRESRGAARSTPPRARAAAPTDAAVDRLKSEIHAALAERIATTVRSRGVDDATRLAELRAEVADVVTEQLARAAPAASAEEAARLREEIVEEALGFGPLQELLRDPNVSEIMVNGNRIYVERGGKIEQSTKRFASHAQVRLIIERIVAPVGRRIDEAQPMVDARLADGSRVNAIVEPLAIDGPALTIRKFPEHRMTADELVALETLTDPLADFLRAAVEARLNVVISGGTGTGKTTLLNVLSGFLPADERIVTIEDAAELSLAQEHVVRLEARPPNIQGTGEVTIRDLVRNALRMRPDRIIVGECRGGEALDMLQAMNTGHDGSLTTVHANSPRDALSRIETLVLMAGFDLPVRAIREQLAGAVDLIVQLTRLRDGSRKVVSLSEVAGLEGDVVTMQEIARFEQRGVDGEGRVRGDFIFTGVQPLCLQRFAEIGVRYDVRALSSLTRAVNW